MLQVYILAYKIKNISKDLKTRITDLIFTDDGVIHTVEYDKEIIYDDENGIKQIIFTKQRLILT